MRAILHANLHAKHLTAGPAKPIMKTKAAPAGVPYDDPAADRSSSSKEKGNIAMATRTTHGTRHAGRPAKAVPLVAALRAKMGLARKTFSRLAGFSERAIADWESGKSLSEPGLRRVREIERFQQRLAEVISSEAIPAWLETPNDAFDGLKPLEVIERGEIDRLWNMIFYLESGVAS